MKSSEQSAEKKGLPEWAIILIILVVVIVFAYYFLFKKEEKHRTNLNEKLRRKETELEELKTDISNAQTLWHRSRRIKKNIKLSFRLTLVAVLAALNFFYIRGYYPDPSLKDVMEGMACLNASLLFICSTIFFIVSGKIPELKETLFVVEVLIIKLRLGQSQEMIESLLEMKEMTRQALLLEISQIKAEIEALQIITMNDENSLLPASSTEVTAFSSPDDLIKT